MITSNKLGIKSDRVNCKTENENYAKWQNDKRCHQNQEQKIFIEQVKVIVKCMEKQRFENNCRF